MRMDSADYTVARRLSVCPSVRICHTPVFCQTVTYILKVFLSLVSPTTLVFPHQTGWQYSDGDPNGGVECKGYEKITIFDQLLSLLLLNKKIISGISLRTNC